jgi:hypothetical protein
MVAGTPFLAVALIGAVADFSEWALHNVELFYGSGGEIVPVRTISILPEP